MNLFRRVLLAGVRRALPPITPRQRQLPLRYQIHRWEGGMEAELRFLDRIVAGRKTALDVGANVGLYSFRLARLFQRVVAFEPNDELTGDLRAWNPGNVEIVNQALSAVSGEAILKIPWVGGRVQHGWASLEEKNLPVAERILEKRIRVEPLDNWEIPDVSFIKIDVEGHEASMLRGAVRTIARDRPIVLVEVRESTRAAVAAYFGDLNYSAHKISDFAPAAGSHGNVIFVPMRPPTP
jgi:FkbM family methyltransferase